MGDYDLNANLEKNGCRRILAEVFTVCLKIKYFYWSQGKGGLI
jgi:hypothetical protein